VEVIIVIILVGVIIGTRKKDGVGRKAVGYVWTRTVKRPLDERAERVKAWRENTKEERYEEWREKYEGRRDRWRGRRERVKRPFRRRRDEDGGGEGVETPAEETEKPAESSSEAPAESSEGSPDKDADADAESAEKPRPRRRRRPEADAPDPLPADAPEPIDLDALDRAETAPSDVVDSDHDVAPYRAASSGGWAREDILEIELTSPETRAGKGGLEVYGDVVTNLQASVMRIRAFKEQLPGFAAGLTEREWGTEVTKELDDCVPLLDEAAGYYEQAAAEIKAEGDKLRQVHTDHPYVPSASRLKA
jgi:hypothetical protein